MKTVTRALAALFLIGIAALVGAGAQPGGAGFVTVRADAPKTAAPGKAFTLSVVIAVASPFHIQADKTREGYIPTEVKVGGARGITAGGASFPTPKMETIAGEELPTFAGKVTVKIPVRVAASVRPGRYTLPVTVKYQGCNETSCFPPAEAKAKAVITVAAMKPAPGRK